MTAPRKIAIAALVLGLVLAGFAALAANHLYWNHIAAECGADCGGPQSERTVQGGF